MFRKSLRYNDARAENRTRMTLRSRDFENRRPSPENAAAIDGNADTARQTAPANDPTPSHNPAHTDGFRLSSHPIFPALESFGLALRMERER